MISGNSTIFGIDPYSISATPVHPLGTKGITPDGRMYRYAQAASTALTIGTLHVAADLVANHEDRAFATAGVANDTEVSIAIGATNIAAGEYVEGYLVIVDDTGEGRIHSIKRHGVNSGAANVTFEIYPGLQAATTTSTTITLVKNKYRDVVISDGVQTDEPVGVSTMAVTADNYCWLATGGVYPVLADAVITAGTLVTIGSSTSGAVEAKDADAEVVVGRAPRGVDTTDGEYNPIFLSLDS